jgi:hypothetical protein
MQSALFTSKLLNQTEAGATARRSPQSSRGRGIAVALGALGWDRKIMSAHEDELEVADRCRDARFCLEADLPNRSAAATFPKC